MKNLVSIDELADFLQANSAVAIYFGSQDCGVCQNLRPRIMHLLQEDFPLLAVAAVDSRAAPELAAQQMVFSIPVLVVFFHGQETLRLARNFSVGQLASSLERPYQLFFSHEKDR